MAFDMLLSPIKVGNLTLKNRILSAPTSLGDITPTNAFTPEAIAYFERKAKGGAAVVNVGDCIAHGRTGKDHAHIIILDDPGCLPSLQKLTDAVHRYGAYAAVEFGHGGKRCNPAYLPAGQLPIGPCDVFDGKSDRTAQAMDRACMEEVLEGYRKSAFHCALAGFDMLTIHAGHGWLLGQFLSELSNHRTDAYGGSRENRCRFVIEVLKAVRQGAPKCVIDLRISGTEYTKDGYDLAEGVELCKLLEPYVDSFNISAGVMEDLFTWILMHPSMFVPDGCNVYLAEAVKRAVKKPVSCVGALGDPEQMEAILQSGQADMICLGRGLVADPDLPKKLREGRVSDIRRCLRCYSCFGQLLKTETICCTVNPEIGQELEVKYRQPAGRKHRVAVIGSGPGGMQAAITAAQRGHDVTVYEASNRLGGALQFAEHEDFKQFLHRFMTWQIHTLEQLGVPVILNQTVNLAFLDSLAVDDVICAVGADPILPSQFGITGDNYVLGTHIFDEGVTLGRRIVIIGGGLVGCETALHLAEEGHPVTILEMAPEIAAETTAAHRRGLKVRMGLHPDMAGGRNTKPGLVIPTIATSTKCKAITDRGVLAVTPDGQETLFEADTVISALGLRARAALVNQLRKTRHNFIPIGDCQRPRQVTQAVREGYDAAATLD